MENVGIKSYVTTTQVNLSGGLANSSDKVRPGGYRANSGRVTH